MDLVIETSDYIFSLDGIGLTFIDIFMMNTLNISIKEGTYYLTKKEIQKLINYLEDNKDEFKNQIYFTSILDKFKSMEMLMKTNEKVKFLFW